MEIPCPACPTREILMTDKWNFPAELLGDKRTSGDEFSCVLALFSAPKFSEKGVHFKVGNPKVTCFFPQAFGILSVTKTYDI